MRQFSTYIEYTLMTRQYVFVPGIGGFLLREVDASYSNHRYTPSHREIHFNRFLTKDDGMLANAYMEADNISYEEAISQIQLEVAQIKVALDKKQSFKLGNLGTLAYASEHHLTIKQPKLYSFYPENYGLNVLELRPWQEIESAKSKTLRSEEKNANVISIPTFWLKRAAAIIILLACIFFNADFNQEENKYDYASVIETDILFGTASPNTSQSKKISEENWEEEKTLSMIEANAASHILEIEKDTEKPITSIVETNKDSENSSAITIKQTSINTTHKLYYIIIGSCTSLKEAEMIAKKKESLGYENIGILERDNRFRLYLKSFTDRAEGEKYLQEVRTSTPFQKAWLLPVRQESLISFILKNFDNDQLPMELSHSHKRTERDQGWINT